MRTLILALVFLAASTTHAATTVEAVTPSATSVEVGQAQNISARFRDAAGNPSVGEMVTFTSESCGSFGGMSQVTVATGAGGIATASFTAGLETGIRCFVRAAAVVTAVFSVVTYRVDQVVFGTTVLANPSPPLPGRPFTIEAFVKVGILELPNVDFTVTVIRGTTNATISPAAGNTGSLTRLQVNVFPEDIVGDLQIEFDFRGRKLRFPLVMGTVAGTFQDMWWAGNAENGWGMSLVQHGDTIFAVLYVYTDAGLPTWYVMSGGSWDATHTVYTGSLYSPRGSPFFAYDASRFTPGAEVGTLAITFNDASQAVIDYTINGKSGTKGISRQPVGGPLATTMANRGDMYWGGVSQNGWGVAVLQQYEGLFIVWFTYDAAGLPVWYVMPAGTRTPTSFDGRMYRTTGSAWLGAQYRASQLSVIDVGPFRLRFTEGTPSGLDYAVDTRTGTLSLSRQPF